MAKCSSFKPYSVILPGYYLNERILELKVGAKNIVSILEDMSRFPVEFRKLNHLAQESGRIELLYDLEAFLNQSFNFLLQPFVK